MEKIEDKENIEKIELQSKTGKVYFLEKKIKGGWKIERKETGSIENVSLNLVERIKERIENGEVISFREINNTVAVETAVLFLLRDIIHIDNKNKKYSKIKKNNKETYVNKNAWIFRGNQDSFDVNTYLRKFNYVYWSVPIKKYQKEIKVGDKVFLWRSKGKSDKPYGVIAYGEIVEEPKTIESIKYPNNLGNDLWKKEEISDIKTGILIDSFRLDLESGLISSDILTRSKICSGMQLLTAKQGTNFKINYQQFEFINNLWFGNEFDEEDDEEGSDESKTVLRLHKVRERDSGLVRKAKENFIKNNGKLFCEVCKFDFNKVYGIDYAEAHHKKPLSQIKSGEKTKINDLAILCSNCHSAVHRFKVDDPLKELKGKFES